MQLSSRARTLVPFSIEAKNQERLNIWDALAQSQRNCSTSCHPCVVFTRNHHDTFIALPWSRFLDLLVAARHAAPRAVSSSAHDAPAHHVASTTHDVQVAIDVLQAWQKKHAHVSLADHSSHTWDEGEETSEDGQYHVQYDVQ